MKANELRIGNLVLAPMLFGVVSITEIKTSTVLFQVGKYPIEYDIDTITPIPLTEEWLLKFGVGKIDANIGLKEEFKKPNNYHYELKGFGEYYPDMGCIEVLGEHPGFYIKCKHVHELQNLYFALTGEELEIK